MKGYRMLMIAATAGLVACGGSSSSSSSSDSAKSSPVPEGFYQGTSSNGAVVRGVLLDDGEYYFLYGEELDGIYNVAGVIQGDGTASVDTFNSPNLKDFSLLGDGVVLDGGLNVNYVRNQNLTGKVTYASGEMLNFSLAYDDTYEDTPDLNADAGAYSGPSLNTQGGGNATIEIDSSGQLTGEESGCEFSGKVAPRSNGNVYNLSVTFDTGPCTYLNKTLTGIAYANDGSLVAVAPDAARDGGIFFLGNKDVMPE